MWPGSMAWQSRLGVEGPMARNVDDLGLLLSVMAGPDARDPRSIVQEANQFANITDVDFTGTRIAWTPDLGELTVEQCVRDVCSDSLASFAELGCEIRSAHPDMSDAMAVFRVLRASYYAVNGAGLLAQHRDKMKATLVENIEIGLTLTADDLHRADDRHTALYQRVVRFFEDHDFLILPTTR